MKKRDEVSFGDDARLLLVAEMCGPGLTLGGARDLQGLYAEAPEHITCLDEDVLEPREKPAPKKDIIPIGDVAKLQFDPTPRMGEDPLAIYEASL